MTQILPHRRARRSRPRSPRGRARSSHAPQPPPPRAAAAERGQHDDQRRAAGAPPRFAVPDFIALSPDAETVGDRARRSAQVLWDDLNFEREFALIPRDIYATIPPRDVVRRRAVRSLARAERRRRDRRHRAEDGDGDPGRGAAVQRAHAAVGVRHGVQRLGRPTRGSSRTRSPTRSTSSSARCAASRARS